MSLGGTGYSQSFRDAIKRSIKQGVVYTVAAGNDGVDVYGSDRDFHTSDDIVPAAYPEVATISALADSDGKPGGKGPSTSYGEDDTFASFSNFSHNLVEDSDNPSNSTGKAIDLILPGVNIYSTYKGGDYETLSGTSMSSPHAAGLAALHIIKNGDPTDASGVTNIREALIDKGLKQSNQKGLVNDGASDPDGNKEHLGWAGKKGLPSVSWVDPNDGETVSGKVGLNIKASDSDGSISKVEWNIDSGSWIEAKDNDSDSYYDDTLSSSNYSDGSHNMNARVTDDAGNTNSSSISITIDNVNDSPTASFTYSCSDLTCDFDGSGSSDSDGSISKYEWDFTSDGSYDATGETVSNTYDSEGDYDVTLRVTDDDGATDTKTKTVSVSSGSTSDMYVWDLSFSQKNYGPGDSFHDLTSTITIQSDSDGDGTAESGDNPVSDASVSYTLVHDSNGDDSYDCSTDDCWNFSGTTDSNGQVSFTLKRAPTGDYKGEITDLTHSSYNWNSSLDADNPDYTTVN